MTRDLERKTDIAKTLQYYAKKGIIKKVRQGIYTRLEYNPEELACCFFPPCYLSLEYVLLKSGIIFQYDETLTGVSYLTREIEVDKHRLRYRRINPTILLSPLGIERKDGINIATKERAFLDMYYLYPLFYFDYPDLLDKEKVKEILPIYKNKSLEKRVCNLLNIRDYE